MLRGTAWLDLSAGPVVLSVPDTGGRLYTLTLVDLWNDAFAVLGKRSTGTAKSNTALVPPGWSGTLPSGMPRIDAPTTHVLARLLIQADGPAEYPAVHALQDGFVITPLSQWNLPPQATRARRRRTEHEGLAARAGRVPADRRPVRLRLRAAAQESAARRRPARAGPAARRGADPRPSLRLRQAGSSRQTRHAPGPAGRARAHAGRCRRHAARGQWLAAGSGRRRRVRQCLHAPRAGRPGPARRQPAGGPGHAAAGRRRPGRGRGRLAPLSPALRQRPVAAGRRLLVAGGLRRPGPAGAQRAEPPGARQPRPAALQRGRLAGPGPRPRSARARAAVQLAAAAGLRTRAIAAARLPARPGAAGRAVDAAAAAVGSAVRGNRRGCPPPPSPATDADPTAAPSAGGRSRPHRPPRPPRRPRPPSLRPRARPSRSPCRATDWRGDRAFPRRREQGPAPSAQEKTARARASRYHIHFSNQERPTWTTPSATNCR